MIRGMIHCKCGTETSEYHRWSGEGRGLTISDSMTHDRYNGVIQQQVKNEQEESLFQ